MSARRWIRRHLWLCLFTCGGAETEKVRIKDKYTEKSSEAETNLRHAVEINEVAEAEWGQVEAGLLATVGALDGNGHLHVVRRPRARVVFPLPLPTLTWS